MSTINSNLNKLEENIGYVFKDKRLLELALTHSSCANERTINKQECNERIEFLGDAVLELVSSEYLYQTYPNKDEGQMTKLRASLVCEMSLANDAREVSLQEFIKLGAGEEKTGGRNRDSIVSDAFESVIGAIYLDGGLEPAKLFILKNVLSDVENKALFYDSKSILQEYVQDKIKKHLHYELIDEFGPDHDKTFVTQVFLDDEPMQIGKGHNKKASEMRAAYETLVHIKNLQP